MMQITINVEQKHIEQILDEFCLTDFQKELVAGVWRFLPNDFETIAKIISAHENGGYLPDEETVDINRKLLIAYTYQIVLNTK